MRKMKLVLVGNGMAGIRTLEELLKIAPDLYDITVFGAETHPNYNRILLSPVLAGEQTLDEIVLNPLSWYEEHGIHLHLGKKVVDVDRRRRIVRAADGTEAEYDRLLLGLLLLRPAHIPVLMRHRCEQVQCALTFRRYRGVSYPCVLNVKRGLLTENVAGLDVL